MRVETVILIEYDVKQDNALVLRGN